MLHHTLLISTCLGCYCDHHQAKRWTRFAQWALVNVICSISVQYRNISIYIVHQQMHDSQICEQTTAVDHRQVYLHLPSPPFRWTSNSSRTLVSILAICVTKMCYPCQENQWKETEVSYSLSKLYIIVCAVLQYF